jgi:hypothetical protein
MRGAAETADPFHSVAARASRRVSAAQHRSSQHPRFIE